MLRRYNSKNLDTILLKTRRTTIGSAPTCDVVVKGKGIAEVHASIESNSTGYILKEHSLSGITKVNDRPVFGQVQIHSGDLIQVGGSPPFVFDSEWMLGTRPTSAATTKVGVARRSSSIPTVPTVLLEEGKKKEPMLPMIQGKKIHPHQSLSDSSVKKRTLYSKFGKEPSSSANHSLRSSASSTESHNRAIYSNRSIGNNLLQRVVKLQAEIIEKDEKIRQLSSSSSANHHTNSLPNHLFYYQPTLPPPHPHHHSFPQAPPLLPQATPPLLAPLSHRSQPKNPKVFELFAYRAFVGAITSQLRQFNDRVIRHPQRDSAELFSAMCRAVDVPLASRIGDIEKYCEAVLIDNDFEDGDELMGRLDNFIRESRREKILELTNELEVLMPLIRDAASNARENIKVCNVFTQWSRQFGDLLRKNSFSATTLFQAIEDLKTQFSEAHMSRHWLPPSITPILRLAALEIEKRDGDVTPLISPRKPGPPIMFERRKSIDMTLDTCISQVETLTHEMDYHVVRLNNKAKDYSTFQPLDLDTVTRISKILESMKSHVDLLAEHSFKEERPNSVMFFEITNEDIKNEIRKSDGEGSTGSLSSLKKISAPPKIPEVFSEDDEILEERREVEGEILKIIGQIGEKIGGSEGDGEPQRNQGMISLDATILKTLIQQSQRLLSSYESSEELARRKRSAPPMIFVENEEVGNSEDLDDVKEPEEEPVCAKPAQPIIEEPPILALKDSEDPTTPEIVTPREESGEDPEEELKKVLHEALTSSETAPEDSESPKINPTTSESPTSSEPRPATPEHPNPKVIAPGADLPFTLIMPEQPESPAQTMKNSPGNSEDVKDSDDVEILDSDDSDDNRIDDESEEEDLESEESEKVTVMYIPSEATPQELTPQNSQHSDDVGEDFKGNGDPENVPEGSDDVADPLEDSEDIGSPKDGSEDVKDPLEGSEDIPENSEDVRNDSEEIEKPKGVPEDSENVRSHGEDSESSEDVKSLLEDPDVDVALDSEPSKPMGNGHALRETRSEDRMSSHLKSHINTANGKPMVTYQYPIRRYYSPPMKRRSKSEDQKIRETLKNRPPFVLY